MAFRTFIVVFQNVMFWFGLALVLATCLSERVREYCWPKGQREASPKLWPSIVVTTLIVPLSCCIAYFTFNPEPGSCTNTMVHAATMLGMLVAALLVAKWGEGTWRAALLKLGVGPLKNTHVWIGILGYAVMMSAFMLTAIVNERLRGATGTSEHATLPTVWGGIAAQLLTMAILGSLAEEVVYRGMFFGSLRDALGFWPAMILSSSVFGLVHGSNQAPQMFVVGWAYSWLYNRTGSLWPVIIAHAMNNGICVFLARG